LMPGAKAVAIQTAALEVAEGVHDEFNHERQRSHCASRNSLIRHRDSSQ
jgi:hypothetical protein